MKKSKTVDSHFITWIFEHVDFNDLIRILQKLLAITAQVLEVHCFSNFLVSAR